MRQETTKTLYELLTTKNYTVKTLDSTGKEETNFADVKMYSFDFETNGSNYGPIVILLTRTGGMEVYFGDLSGKTLDAKSEKVLSDLWMQLKTFASRNMLGFKLENINRLKYSMQSMAGLTESKNIFESYYGTKKTSYSPQANAKIIIKHSKNISESDKRYRNIKSIFIENSDGERFKLPFKKIAGARAMARHVTEGGNPYDIFGQHICETVKDISTLGGFLRNSKIFEDDSNTTAIIESSREHYAKIKKDLGRMASKRGYNTYKESWEPLAITESDVDINTIRDMFSKEKVIEKIDNAMPLLARINPQNKELTEFEDWVDNVGKKPVIDIMSIMDPYSEEDEKLVTSAVYTDPNLLEDDKSDFLKFKKAFDTQKGNIAINEMVIGEKYIYALTLGIYFAGTTKITCNYFDKALNYLGDTHKDYPELQNHLFFDNEDSEVHVVKSKNIGAPTLFNVQILNETNNNYAGKMEIFWKLQYPEAKISYTAVNPSELSKDKIAPGELVEDTIYPETQDQIDDLVTWFSEEQPVGLDALDVTDSILSMINDAVLHNELQSLAAKDTDADARPVVLSWLEDYINANPEETELLKYAMDDIKQGDMSESKDIDTDQVHIKIPTDNSNIADKGDGLNKFVAESTELSRLKQLLS